MPPQIECESEQSWIHSQDSLPNVRVDQSFANQSRAIDAQRRFATPDVSCSFVRLKRLKIVLAQVCSRESPLWQEQRDGQNNTRRQPNEPRKLSAPKNKDQSNPQAE